ARVGLELRPDQRTFERRGAVVVSDQAIREDEGKPVDRARRRDSVAQLAEPAQVLHGRLRPRVDDSDHVIAGSKVRASTSAAMRSYSRRSIGRNVTRSPGRSRTGSAAPGSYSRSGVRPSTQKPPGFSSEYMQPCLPPMPMLPAGVVVRGVSRRGRL